mmetsp:Transcript_21483/g.50371  ORF Transcript_21483/g.50371 Transcript_21483/m.50371 type:complete len:242 (-) Transcript_21483:15-740(-)
MTCKDSICPCLAPVSCNSCCKHRAATFSCCHLGGLGSDSDVISPSATAFTMRGRSRRNSKRTSASCIALCRAFCHCVRGVAVSSAWTGSMEASGRTSSPGSALPRPLSGPCSLLAFSSGKPESTWASSNSKLLLLPEEERRHLEFACASFGESCDSPGRTPDSPLRKDGSDDDLYMSQPSPEARCNCFLYHPFLPPVPIAEAAGVPCSILRRHARPVPAGSMSSEMFVTCAISARVHVENH